MVYVRIVEDAKPIPGKPLFMVQTETAPGHLQSVMSNQLYSFRSGSTQKAGGTPSAPIAAPSTLSRDGQDGVWEASNASREGTPPAVVRYSLREKGYC